LNAWVWLPIARGEIVVPVMYQADSSFENEIQEQIPNIVPLTT
jgi:hypothetical protein